MSQSTFRSRRRDVPEINVASLVDVVLLLLLFFMLSTTFNRPTELQIELPEVTQKTTTNEQSTPPSINVKLDQHGHCFINQQTIKTPTATNLEPLLRQLSANRSDIPVEIEADARTPHQAVITVMDAARRAGLLQIAFTAMQEWQ